MNRVYLTMAAAWAAAAAHGQDFPSGTGNTMCTMYPDTWEVRTPTAAEEAEHGRGILVFEYRNSKHGCSQETEMGVYHGDHRFVMTVEINPFPGSQAERITIDTQVAPFAARGQELILDDDESSGTIILYPSLF